MPYINQYEKDLIDQRLKPLMNLLMDADKEEVKYGNIEYLFFRILGEAAQVKTKFVNLNGLVGILNTTEHEFVDKIVKPYENSKLLSEWSGERLISKLNVKKTKKKSKKKSKRLLSKSEE